MERDAERVGSERVKADDKAGEQKFLDQER